MFSAAPETKDWDSRTSVQEPEKEGRRRALYRYVGRTVGFTA